MTDTSPGINVSVYLRSPLSPPAQRMVHNICLCTFRCTTFFLLFFVIAVTTPYNIRGKVLINIRVHNNCTRGCNTIYFVTQVRTVTTLCILLPVQYIHGYTWLMHTLCIHALLHVTCNQLRSRTGAVTLWHMLVLLWGIAVKYGEYIPTGKVTTYVLHLFNRVNM